jgi:hypothetical protein
MGWSQLRDAGRLMHRVEAGPEKKSTSLFQTRHLQTRTLARSKKSLRSFMYVVIIIRAAGRRGGGDLLLGLPAPSVVHPWGHSFEPITCCTTRFQSTEPSPRYSAAHARGHQEHGCFHRAPWARVEFSGASCLGCDVGADRVSEVLAPRGGRATQALARKAVTAA